MSLTESDKQDWAAAVGSPEPKCPSESSHRFLNKQIQTQRESNRPQVTTFNSAHLHTVFYCSRYWIHPSADGSQNTRPDIAEDDLSITAAVCLLVTQSHSAGAKTETQTGSQRRHKVPEQVLIQSWGGNKLIFSDTNSPTQAWTSRCKSTQTTGGELQRRPGGPATADSPALNFTGHSPQQHNDRTSRRSSTGGLKRPPWAPSK